MNMNSKLVSAAGAFLALLLLIGWLAGFFTEKIDPTLMESDTVQLDAGRLYRVTVAPVDVTEEIPATIAARDDTVISSRILARIDEVLVRAGDIVDKGQVLIRLEQADLVSRVEQARDQVTAIAAQLEDARLRLDRVTQLRKDGLAAQADVDSARAAFDNLSAQLASAEEALSESEIVLDYSIIKAPIAGRIVERLAEPGDTVSPGAPLLSLYDPLSIRAEARVREGLALGLDLGQPIVIEIASLDRRSIGTIEEIVPAADPGSRSFLVKVSLPYNETLMPGMFARFVVPVGQTDMIRVPQNLVTEVGELNMVKVYKDGRIQRRFVRLGKKYPDDLVAVTAGLEAGEQLVIESG